MQNYGQHRASFWLTPTILTLEYLQKAFLFEVRFFSCLLLLDTGAVDKGEPLNIPENRTKWKYHLFLYYLEVSRRIQPLLGLQHFDLRSIRT